MRCREEDLNRAQLKQRMHEEQLRQKEQELQAREMDLVTRELNFMIKQQTPTPIKRKGNTPECISVSKVEVGPLQNRLKTT